MVFNVHVVVKVICLIWVVTTYSLVVGTSVLNGKIVLVAIIRGPFASMKQHMVVWEHKLTHNSFSTQTISGPFEGLAQTQVQ